MTDTEDNLRHRYHLLDTYSSVKIKTLTKKEIEVLQNSPNNLSKENKEAFVLLIAEYALRNGWDGKGIPYDGIYSDNHTIIQKIPRKLQCILLEFCKKYIKS